MLQADFEGDVKIAGRSIPAAVLPNGKRLFNQGQFLQAIGRTRTPKAGTGGLTLSADGLPFFLYAELLKPITNNELVSRQLQYFFAIDKAAGRSDMTGLCRRICETLAQRTCRLG